MKKYKMIWTDSTLTDEFPSSWFDREDSEEAEKIAYEAIGEFVQKQCFNIPVQVTVTQDMGDYVEFDASFEFEAEDEADLLRKVNTIQNVNGRDIECFSVLDEAGEPVLTEEDLQNDDK